MKRRDFLKILGACIIASGTAIVVVKAGPKQIPPIDMNKPLKWKNFYAEYKPNAAQKKILLEKFKVAFKNTKSFVFIGFLNIIIYDEFDYTTVNFLKKHRINIPHDKASYQSPEN